MADWTETTWTGCYEGSWRGAITDESFSHPAKAARGLLERIFDHLFERGWLKRGDICVDPFGGIFTTGIIGASRGVRVFGCELEPKFHALAQANIKLHRRAWEEFGDPIPVCVCGDSRNLVEILGPVIANCVVSSPPFGEAHSGGGITATGTPHQGRASGTGGYRLDMHGTTPGQLGNMKPGDVDSIVSSPPWGNEEPSNASKEWHQSRDSIGKNNSLGVGHYGDTPGNIGNDTGSTFWEAAQIILAQCFAILRPGGIAVFVLKDFVRAGKRVDFSDQWRRAAEACGFVTVEWIRASLIKEDRHPGLFGEDVVKTTKRASFFRRLAEAKGSPAIDWESVIITRKP